MTLPMTRTIRSGKMLFALCAATLGATNAIAPANAAVVVQDISGVTSSRFRFFWGQSFTTPVATTWNNISFSLYDQFYDPAAVGIGYIFASAYVGAPDGLATAGALAVSAPTNSSAYVFSPGFRLAPATQYFFYESSPILIRGGGTATIGGASVFSSAGNQAFTTTGGGNANFTVNGTTAAVPEPAAWFMLIAGFAATGIMARRRATRRSLSIPTA